MDRAGDNRAKHGRQDRSAKDSRDPRGPATSAVCQFLSTPRALFRCSTASSRTSGTCRTYSSPHRASAPHPQPRRGPQARHTPVPGASLDELGASTDPDEGSGHRKGRPEPDCGYRLLGSSHDSSQERGGPRRDGAGHEQRKRRAGPRHAPSHVPHHPRRPRQELCDRRGRAGRAAEGNSRRRPLAHGAAARSLRGLATRAAGIAPEPERAYRGGGQGPGGSRGFPKGSWSRGSRRSRLRAPTYCLEAREGMEREYEEARRGLRRAKAALRGPRRPVSRSSL